MTQVKEAQEAKVETSKPDSFAVLSESPWSRRERVPLVWKVARLDNKPAEGGRKPDSREQR